MSKETKEPEDERILIPGPKSWKKIEASFADEDFVLDQIKLTTGIKPKFELPIPGEDDGTTSSKFQAVILFARPITFKGDEKPDTKRVLYLLRTGCKVPEYMFLSVSSTFRFRKFGNTDIKKAREEGIPFCGVLVEFSGKHVENDDYKWNVVEFKTIRYLEDDELTYVQQLQPLVKEFDSRFAGMGDDEEAELFGYERPPATAQADEDEEDDEDLRRKASKSRRSRIEEEEDEDDTPAAPASRERKKRDSDDEDEPKAKGKKKSKSDDEDDEDEPKTKGKKKSKSDDEDDEDEPKAKGKSNGGSKGREKFPNLDEDDDDLEEARPRSRRRSADDEDED